MLPEVKRYHITIVIKSVILVHKILVDQRNVGKEEPKDNLDPYRYNYL